MRMKTNSSGFIKGSKSLKAAVAGVALLVAAPTVAGCDDLQRGCATLSDVSGERGTAMDELTKRKHLQSAKTTLIFVACYNDHKEVRMRAVRELRNDPNSLAEVVKCDDHKDSQNYAKQRLLEMLGTIKNERIVAEMGRALRLGNDKRWRTALRNLERRVDDLTDTHALAFVAEHGSEKNAARANEKLGTKSGIEADEARSWVNDNMGIPMESDADVDLREAEPEEKSPVSEEKPRRRRF